MKTIQNSNFTRNISENNHNINVDINKDFKYNNYIHSILEELHIHNGVKQNKFNNILYTKSIHFR